MLEGKGWNVVYWHNHDQPRVLSHYGNDQQWRVESAKMLAMALYFMPGTAICYQGEEIGMTNVLYENLSDFRDVEVFTEYQNFLRVGYDPQQALAILQARCRDNARSPMQWSAGTNGGFSEGTPWIRTNPNYPAINVENQEKDPESILSLYRKILPLRNADDNIREGRLTYLNPESQSDYSYLNQGPSADHLVLCNFTGVPQTFDFSGWDFAGFVPLMQNFPDRPSLGNRMSFRPYETMVFRRSK